MPAGTNRRSNKDRRTGPIRSGEERRHLEKPIPDGVSRSGADRRGRDRRSGVERRKTNSDVAQA